MCRPARRRTDRAAATLNLALQRSRPTYVVRGAAVAGLRSATSGVTFTQGRFVGRSYAVAHRVAPGRGSGSQPAITTPHRSSRQTNYSEQARLKCWYTVRINYLSAAFFWLDGADYKWAAGLRPSVIRVDVPVAGLLFNEPPRRIYAFDRTVDGLLHLFVLHDLSMRSRV